MVRSALDLAQVTTEDPHAGLPEPEELGSLNRRLHLYDDAVASLDTDWKIEQAREAEETALAADPRIQNSEGASFDSHVGRARVRQFAAVLPGHIGPRAARLSVVPVARATAERWSAITGTRPSRRVAGIESAEEVGRRAAARAVRRLNPRKVHDPKGAGDL